MRKTVSIVNNITAEREQKHTSLHVWNYPREKKKMVEISRRARKPVDNGTDFARERKRKRVVYRGNGREKLARRD